MPVLPPNSSIFNTTVQNIADGVAQDLRQVLSSTTNPGQTILFDYVNRISLQMLRESAWRFLESQPIQFMTQMNATNYWIGPIGSAPAGFVDANVGLADVRSIEEDSFYDRTNFRKLIRTDSAPLVAAYAFPDSTLRPGPPRMYRSEANSNKLNGAYMIYLYPAPDNAGSYYPIPEAPIVTVAPGGSLANRIYYIMVTFVDSLGGESSHSLETKIFVPAGYLVTVQQPIEPLVSSSGVQYNRWNVYASTSSQSEQLQNASPLSSATFTEPGTGLITGASFPTTNKVEPIDGYLMEFRYFKYRVPLSSPLQVLQIPDDYKDIVIAGVNWLGFEYLKRPGEAEQWKAVYANGIREMIRDKWQFPKGADYIRTDGTTIESNFPMVEVTDPSTTRTN